MIPTDHEMLQWAITELRSLRPMFERNAIQYETRIQTLEREIRELKSALHREAPQRRAIGVSF
jgi:hypothetical protein